MGFKSMVEPSPRGPSTVQSSTIQSLTQAISFFLRNNFHISTLLLLAGIFQSLLLLAIPRFYALLPSVLILAYRFADTLLITFRFKPNPYIYKSLLKKHSTVLPDSNGNLPTEDSPGEQKVAVLLLAFKLHHPLGLLSPYTSDVNDWGAKIYPELEENRDNNGFLGHSQYSTHDEQGNFEVVDISYWRSKEDIAAYAHGETHLKAWKWWETLSAQKKGSLDHIGISHEIFESPAGHWESMYLNQAPLRLGATTYKQTKENGEIQWISPVVAARGPLATNDGRLSWPTG